MQSPRSETKRIAPKKLSRDIIRLYQSVRGKGRQRAIVTTELAMKNRYYISKYAITTGSLSLENPSDLISKKDFCGGALQRTERRSNGASEMCKTGQTPTHWCSTELFILVKIIASQHLADTHASVRHNTRGFHQTTSHATPSEPRSGHTEACGGETPQTRKHTRHQGELGNTFASVATRDSHSTSRWPAAFTRWEQAPARRIPRAWT